MATSPPDSPGQAVIDEFCDALWLEDGQSIDALMSHADKAMYAFKSARGEQRGSTAQEVLAGA